eukprot:TRINITY_DN9579_c0_g1_i1.p1 TRINITY_DN9579_c0_g1~~TRINITY_DN9579_c0_g1_i1.p1  ORF type:complete len:131 (-),score=12.36 TRINITY_DN9579_c0_g1_i1:54-419(-)
MAENSYVWRDQHGVHKIVPGRDGTKVNEEEFQFSSALDEDDGMGAFSFERRHYRDLEGTKHDLQVILKANGVYEVENKVVKLYWDKKSSDYSSLQDMFPKLTDGGDMTIRANVHGEERIYV